MTPRQREALICTIRQNTREQKELTLRDPEAGRVKARADLMRSGLINEDGSLHENYLSRPNDMSVRWTKECGEGFMPLRPDAA